MTRVPASPLPPTLSRTAQVADWFAREIRSGRFASGEKLPTEQELIGQFNVSRTVIREAMASLRSEGLVVSRQGSGVFVADHETNTTFRIVSDEVRSLTEVLNVLQLRLAVESEAAGIAAEKRTDEDLAQMRRCLDVIDASIAAGGTAIESDFAFHRAISSATGNPYFERFMHFLGPVIIPRQSIRPKSETPDQRRHYLEQVQMEHRRIYQAIERRNVEAARFTLREHLEASRERYRGMFDHPSAR
ncbi:FadR/GntR family transcriptional regulator [Labrys wisconsinensis]|uniref:GntR family transcriptional repressor for pyruvate dehydrogenase complex n=1 Tax=Labrys wisconsinensis TaxID=425677 RepID=A0ABU0JE85_9HYPH|nr:FadR/GntR family transcriptional regulator [Labrys wisconsinensis]MDQ0471452.1 GntR family transcriptional repressor for pyruvate dehydrogenase complex [Labrys wisconsinensis]